MRDILGILLIVIGVVFGLYVGIGFMFVGGIIDVIEQIRSETLEAMAVAIGVAKIIFFELGGIVAACIFVVPGVLLIEDD